jgi:transposase
LTDLTRKGKSPAREQLRARVLLLSDRSQGEPHTEAEISVALQCSATTVGNIRRRFVREGLEAALHDKPRPGAKPKLTGDVEAKLVTLACSAPPDGRSRWTLRLLAQSMVELEYVESISHVAILKTLKKTHLSLGR